MRYIKTNESFKRANGYFNNITDVVAILSNAFRTLGVTFEAYTSKNDFNKETYPACRISLNLSKIRNSILASIIEPLLDSPIRHNTFFIYNDSKINKEIKNGYIYAHVILTSNDTDNELAEVYKSMSYNITADTKEEIYKNILYKYYKLCLDTNGEIIDNSVGVEVNITTNSFIVDLINKYILYVLNKPMSAFTKGKFNNNDLYKMAYEKITNADEPFKIFNGIKNNNRGLYEQLRKFGDVEKVDISSEMGELGFQ